MGLRLHQLNYPSSTGSERREIELTGTFNFVPSDFSRSERRKEGIAYETIYVTGSMLVEAVQMAAARIGKDDVLKADLAAAFPFLDPNRRLIFVTEHRHARRGARLDGLYRALKRLAMRPDLQVACSVMSDSMHDRIMAEIFAGYPNITLIRPQDYVHLTYLMQSAHFVLTDQDDYLQEALSLRKPVLIMRNAGEFPKAGDWGTTKLVGTDSEHILRECSLFLDDQSHYRAYSNPRIPHRDGHTSRRIVETLLR